MSILSSVLSDFRPKASRPIVRLTEAARPIAPTHIGGIQRNSLFNAEKVATAVFSHILSYLSPKEIHSLRMSHYTGLTLERSMRMIQDQMEAQQTATFSEIRKYEKVMGKNSFSSSRITHLVVDNPNITEEEFISLIQRMPRLIRIDLTDCINIRDASLLAIAKHLPKLQILNLRKCPFTDQGLMAIGAGCRGLLSIDISECRDFNYYGFYAIVSQCKALQSLKMVNSKHGQMWIEDITDECHQLRVLDIRGCSFLSDGYSNIANCKNLQHLSVDSAGSPDIILKYIANCSNLKTLRIIEAEYLSGGGIKHLASCTQLHSLYVSGSDWMTLEDIALHLPRLRILHATQCTQTTDAGLKKLGEACKELQELDVSDCPGITTNGINDLNNNFPMLKIKHTTITKSVPQKSVPQKSVPQKAVPQKAVPQVPQKRPSVFRFVMEQPATHAAISALFANYAGFWPGVLLFAGMQGVSYAMRNWMRLW